MMTDLLNLCDSRFPLNGATAPNPTAFAASSFAKASDDRSHLLGLEVVGEARTWLNTPFRHQGRIKGVGVDCLGLLVGVAKARGLIDGQGRPLAALDELSYGHFPDEDYLQQRLGEALQEVPQPQSGGIGLFRIDGRAQHLSIFSHQPSTINHQLFIIHAYAPARKVVEHGFTAEWQERLIKSYTPV